MRSLNILVSDHTLLFLSSYVLKRAQRTKVYANKPKTHRTNLFLREAHASWQPLLVLARLGFASFLPFVQDVVGLQCHFNTLLWDKLGSDYTGTTTLGLCLDNKGKQERENFRKQVTLLVQSAKVCDRKASPSPSPGGLESPFFLPSLSVYTARTDILSCHSHVR